MSGMRKFTEAYPEAAIVSTLSAKLRWSYVTLMVSPSKFLPHSG